MPPNLLLLGGDHRRGEPGPMSQNRFRPFHAAHAIIEQMVFFQFTPPLDRAIPALIKLKDELRDDLPQSELLNTFQVDFVDGQQVAQQNVESAGILLFRTGNDGNRDWSVNITAESISIHCTRYTRWQEIWPKEQELIRRIFEKIAASKSFMTAVGTRWIDQFVYDGPDEEYNAHDLLREGSPHLNSGAFSSGDRWHCHTGWFDKPLKGGSYVLNQLNVSSARINQGGHLRTAVTIDHAQQLRADGRIDQLADYLPTTAEGLVTLSDLMEALHDGNKRILTDLLNDSMGERIGLRSGHTG